MDCVMQRVETRGVEMLWLILRGDVGFDRLISFEE